MSRQASDKKRGREGKKAGQDARKRGITPRMGRFAFLKEIKKKTGGKKTEGRPDRQNRKHVGKSGKAKGPLNWSRKCTGRAANQKGKDKMGSGHRQGKHRGRGKALE